MSDSYSASQNQFEEYVRDGITAAKNGERKLAAMLLNRALLLNHTDARPYLWLSATTDDPQEQREYLERAVSLDPSNMAARRGLAMLTGKFDPRLAPAGGRGAGRPPTSGAAAGRGTGDRQVFQCPKCGGRMSFAVGQELLVCEYCGHSLAAQNRGGYIEQTEQVLDFYVGTHKGNRWATAEQEFKCEKCGALSLLPPSQSAVQCPYCGSNQLVHSPEHDDLVPPQAVVVMQINEKDANRLALQWLGRGLLSPGSLGRSASTLRLRPAYYSCWTFDGTVEIRWSCEVAEGSGSNKRWIPAHGVETRFFNDILVSGVSAFPDRELDRLGPFEIPLAEIFQIEYLAGWPTILYDRSLTDASLIGREKVMRHLRPQMYSLVETGREKRGLQVGSGSWSGMTFKHILLPFWLGEYQFQGKAFCLWINGQNGKVQGEKPRDKLKLTLLIGLGITLLIALIVILSLLVDSGTI